MKKLSSNPYVYPYVPFYNLNDKRFRAKFESQEKIDFNQLKKLTSNLEIPKIKPKGRTIEGKILSVFLDKNVVFGPRDYITKDINIWTNEFKKFTDNKKPILLSILGFPFKIPVPLKTDRSTPDMGEVLMLKKLHNICDVISKFYKPGATVTIFTEGVFGRYNLTPEKEYKNYFKNLRKINNSLGFNKYVKLVELEEMEKMSKNFNLIFNTKVQTLRSKLKNSDNDIIKKMKGLEESLKRIVNSKIFNLSNGELMDIYNTEIQDNALPKKLERVRKIIHKNITDLGINYLAYLSVRDDLNFLQERIPGVITLSVSPKPGRLGVLPIDGDCVRLGYHGVPVYHPVKKRFSIEYLIDIKRKSGKYKKVFLKDFPESTKPFYYIKIK